MKQRTWMTHAIGTVEAARILGYDPKYLAQMCREGRVACVQIGDRCYALDRRDVERMASDRKK